MKNALWTMFVGAVLLVAGIGVDRAADKADPVVGTWTLNLAKSKFNPGPAPRSQTRTYTQSDDGISLSVTSVGPDGTTMSQQSTFKYGGKQVATTIRTISEHGKVLTLSTKLTGADGKVHDNVAVFDKQ